MLESDKTAASSRVWKRKLNFFIRRKSGTTLPDGSKVKLKREKRRVKLIGGYSGHFKGTKKAALVRPL